jgi:phosphodiesterase/alkaline phosphatase D-like protein
MTPLSVGPLVRATTATSTVVWAEFFQPGEVTLRVTPFDAPENSTIMLNTHTVTVGGRHYAAPQLTGLQPATWYSYRIDAIPGKTAADAGQLAGIEHRQIALPYQCFRTLDSGEAGEHSEHKQEKSLLLAYGSCRKLTRPEQDALGAFGPWLIRHFSKREATWPRLLLLIGDQIYADEPSESLVQLYPHLQGGAHTFADFASMYEYAWTNDQRVRQVLAMLPTYMIFDDHEITNNWDISPTWRAWALQRGQEQVLVDGLVAYWVYQGWGNLHQRTSANSPLLQIMQDAAASGEDTLEALRACIRPEIYGQSHLHWHYEIPTMPPIFVMDARADRPVIFNSKTPFTEMPARITSEQQMTELTRWLYENKRGLPILVSSVPALLPPLIGLAEYLMGIRPWHNKVAPLRWLGRQLARIQYMLAMGISFDHWPLFTATWNELVEILADSQQDILFLSGDVHFSYAMEAHRTKNASDKGHLYQFVSTPLQNELSPNNRRLVLGQTRFKDASYGGLHMRMLPMLTGDKKGRVPHDLLLQNTVALVSLQHKGDEKYEIRQEYLGVKDGDMEVVGRTTI